MTRRNKPDTNLHQLSFLVGKWQSEGEVKATSSNPAIKIKGTDSYEWVLEEKFLLHSVSVFVGDEKVEAIEMIGGNNGSGKSFLMRSFDNQGNFVTMKCKINQAGFLKIKGEKMRSTLMVSKDGTQMTAEWEKSENGKNWEAWMSMKFTK